MDASEVQKIITGLQHALALDYTVVASNVVLVVDYFLTVGLEILLVWEAKLTPMKIIFLLARYLPFFSMSLGAVHHFGSSLTSKSCRLLFEGQAWVATVGIASAELILTLRTWAVWRQDRRLTYFLIFFFLATFTVEPTIMGLFLRSITHTFEPNALPSAHCVLKTTLILSNFYIILMVYDAVTLLLMIVGAVTAFRHGTNHLLRVVYRDGMVYYVYLFALSLVNVLAITILPPEFFNLFVPLESFIHSILACRVVLHIREQSNRLGYQSTALDYHSTLEY